MYKTLLDFINRNRFDSNTDKFSLSDIISCSYTRKMTVLSSGGYKLFFHRHSFENDFTCEHTRSFEGEFILNRIGVYMEEK